MSCLAYDLEKVEFSWVIILDDQGEDIGFILLPTDLCDEKVKKFCASFIDAIDKKVYNIGIRDSFIIFARSDLKQAVHIHCQGRVLSVISKIMSSDTEIESIGIFRVGEYGFCMVIEEFLKIYLSDNCFVHQSAAHA